MIVIIVLQSVFKVLRFANRMASFTNDLTHREIGIMEVWVNNLEDVFKSIRQIVRFYRYVAIDTEFPGVVLKPEGDFPSQAEEQYASLRMNVNQLKLIQLGITFFDEKGNRAKDVFATYQFNFIFDDETELCSPRSMQVLRDSGIDFFKHKYQGIDPLRFSELLMSSGVVLMDNITWISFHSVFDFGYLLKMLTDALLPETEKEFRETLKLYCPNILDVKYILKPFRYLEGGLQHIAGQLKVERVGTQHQAGSDSMLTGLVFFKMREMFFDGKLDHEKYSGILYGLGDTMILIRNIYLDNPDTC